MKWMLWKGMQSVNFQGNQDTETNKVVLQDCEMLIQGLVDKKKKNSKHCRPSCSGFCFVFLISV